ncbi:hypothetical protein ACIP79_19730 [Streptomyces sp. NPDC088747]|uniref:hypothetical protein n=1 Tax=Streptomyces sp. NPDC088747 TaxID=3365886 RepID=UPI003825B0BF
MSTGLSRALAMAAAAVVMAASQLLAGSASAAPAVQSSSTQVQVDDYLASHPGEKQIAPDKATMPGGVVTFSASGAAGADAIACSFGYLCVQDGNGTRWNYYYCGYYEFYGTGNGYFNNNQTLFTTAFFYNSDGSYRWHSTAPQSGTASWTPVYYIQPC